MKKTVIMLLLAMLLICMTAAALADGKVTTQASVAKIKSYGNVVLDLPRSEMLEAGMTLGDIVSVSFGGRTVVMPYCTNFNDVDAGNPVLAWREDHDSHALAVAGGDFVETYGFAQLTDNGWVSPEGDYVTVTIEMYEPRGYYDEYIVRSVKYTDERSDYPQLTDAEFANFREVTVPGIKPGMLYRSASPVNNKHNRAPYAAAAMEAAGVHVVLNLADSEETLQSFDLYPGSYYAAQQVIALEMGMDLSDDDEMVDLADGLRFILAHDGPICIHCLEGKDRTGYVCAVLELLCGATLEDVMTDYMITFSNYYGVTPDSDAWQVFAASFEKTLRKGLGDDLNAVDYLLRCGLEQSEINALRARVGE